MACASDLGTVVKLGENTRDRQCCIANRKSISVESRYPGEIEGRAHGHRQPQILLPTTLVQACPGGWSLVRTIDDK